MTDRVRACQENRLDRTLKQVAYPKRPTPAGNSCLLPSQGDASLFFRPLSPRYEQASLIVTSNNGFVDGGEAFRDPVLATGVLDHLLGRAPATPEASK